MKPLLISLTEKKIFIIAGLIWILGWMIPWGKELLFQGNIILVFLLDMIKLGVAIALFIIPGILLYILLTKDDVVDVKDILPIGFTLSVLIIAVIGLVGRILGLSFTVVKFSFALIGLLEIFLLACSKPSNILDMEIVQSLFSSVIKNPPLMLAFLLAILMTLHDQLFFIDDLSYLAYLTNWQYSIELGFKNLIHEVNAIEHMRFWLAMYPMGQALLAELSGLPGLLLLSNYLELYLVAFAIITSYWFARTLGFSRKAAGFAVLIQVSLYTWMLGEAFPVGMWFYQNLAEDKVTAVFLLAPVFFVFLLNFIHIPSRRNLLLFLLSGFSIALTHPVILFFSCAIALGIGFLATISKKLNGRGLVQIMLLFVMLMLPYAVIRFSDPTGEVSGAYDGKLASTTYQIERYTNIVSDVFYGLNPGVLMFFDVIPESNLYDTFQYIRIIPIIIIIFTGFMALPKLREGPFYWYLLSSIFLILFAAFPFTGWILGYFVSARLISRASWFAPLGLGSVLILKTFLFWYRSRRISKNVWVSRLGTRINGTILGLIVCFVFFTPVLVSTFMPLIPAYFDVLDHNKQLSQVGAYIDQATTTQVMVIALDYVDIQMLPGVSSHTTLISFREEMDYNGHNNFMPLDEVRERIKASNIIRSLDQTMDPEERCGLIENFDLRFVLAESNEVDIYKNIVEKCEIAVEEAYRTKELILLEIK
ncbi:MAG: hypothetical protein ISR59_08295 [Anaerolineales bacterium]|nr:hypothetical protein [Anaerolineales bacterium]